jgi:large subunit ribosomal protein L31e
MAEKNNNNIEREYVIPLREKCRPSPRYKKTSKAVKSVKEFLVRHMKVYDRDLKKIKLDIHLNEFLWSQGIKTPPHSVKVKVKKEGDIVYAELAKMAPSLSFKKARLQKRELKGLQAVENKKSMMQKAKEAIKSPHTNEKTHLEESLQNKGKIEDKSEETKKEIEEKIESTIEEGNKEEKQMAREKKHETKLDKQPAQKKKEHSKGEQKR